MFSFLPFLNLWCSDQYFSTAEKRCKRILNWLVSRERGINEKRNVRKAIDWNEEVFFNAKAGNSLKPTAILWNLRLLVKCTHIKPNINLLRDTRQQWLLLMEIRINFLFWHHTWIKIIIIIIIIIMIIIMTKKSQGTSRVMYSSNKHSTIVKHHSLFEKKNSVIITHIIIVLFCRKQQSKLQCLKCI